MSRDAVDVLAGAAKSLGIDPGYGSYIEWAEDVVRVVAEMDGWSLAPAASLDVTCPVCGSRFDPANFTHHAALASAASESHEALIERITDEWYRGVHKTMPDAIRAALATTPPDLIP